MVGVGYEVGSDPEINVVGPLVGGIDPVDDVRRLHKGRK